MYAIFHSERVVIMCLTVTQPVYLVARVWTRFGHSVLRKHCLSGDLLFMISPKHKQLQ